MLEQDSTVSSVNEGITTMSDIIKYQYHGAALSTGYPNHLHHSLFQLLISAPQRSELRAPALATLQRKLRQLVCIGGLTLGSPPTAQDHG